MREDNIHIIGHMKYIMWRMNFIKTELFWLRKIIIRKLPYLENNSIGNIPFNSLVRAI